MRSMGILMISAILAGCATTGEPTVGSKRWYQTRIQEIDGAYEYGEINQEEYLERKAEVEQIRMDYSAQLRSRLNYDSRVGFGTYSHFGVYTRHHTHFHPVHH